MSFVNFIDFNTDKETALSIRTSPVIEFHEEKGVQLLPNNPLPYVQTTNVNGGIELEDWTAYIVKCDDKPITILGNGNFLLHSEDVSNAAWVKTGLELDLDAIPIGNYFGDRIVATGVNSPHWITQSIVKSNESKKYTASFYVKAAEYKKVYFRASDGNFDAIIFHFDTETQSFSNITEDVGYTNISRGYTDEEAGWYRVYVTFNSTTNVDLDIVVGVVDANDNNIFIGETLNGQNTSGIYVRGFQLKEGNLSDYIETEFQSINTPNKTVIGTDITDYFMVERVFQDNNGYGQFDWSLTNVPFDFGSELIYLKVDQLLGETFYSNKFQLTNIKSEKTSRLDYKAKKTDTMQSIQVQAYFWQDLKQTEKGSYYEVSTRNTVTTTVKSQKFERWRTDFMPNFIMIKIDDVFENKFVYSNLVRANLFEAIDIKKFEAAENFKENEILLSTFKDDIYDPLNVIVEIPPEQVRGSINLQEMHINGSSATYTFSYDNLTPTYLTFQRSEDGVNWTSDNSGITSPQSLPFNDTGVWFFRISHPEAISNVIELNLIQDIVAVNDSINNLPQNEQIILSPLLNDSLIGNTLITAVSTPVNGTATIINNSTQIRYVHDGSNTFADFFEYTIDNGISSDVGEVSVSLVQSETSSTPFLTSTNGESIQHPACFLVLSETRFHDGANSQPELYDYVYTDETVQTAFNGGDAWYPITGGMLIRISETGEIYDMANCF